jgi:hypothetical protein
MVRFEINGQELPYNQVGNEFIINVDCAANIEIFFEPWKTKPLIRVDNHLVNYWLAEIAQFDHMVSLTWDRNFYQKYQQRAMQSKIEYLGISKQEDIDYYLGINNSHYDIVEQIKKYL